MEVKKVKRWKLATEGKVRWRLIFLSWREFRVNVYSSLYYCYSSIPYYDAVLADDGGRMSCETKMSSLVVPVLSPCLSLIVIIEGSTFPGNR